MTESALLFSESYLSKARFARAQNTKLDNSSSFRNHSTSKAFRSFLNGTVQKNESTIPSDSVSYVEEKNYRSLRTEAFRILNDSKDLASIDKSSFLGGERNTSVTPINNGITENNDTRTSLDVGERVIFKRTNNANRPQTGLFLLTANGQTRGKTGSPTPKPVVKKKKVEVEGQRTRNASQKDKGLKDFKFIYGRQSPARKSEVSLTMKRHLIEAKSKDASVSIAKGIDYDQKKIDAKLHLGDSLDLSNGSESPVNAKNYRRNMTCETEGDETKKKKTPIHEIYTDLIKKHLKEEAGTTWKRTPLAGRKLLNNRPQTCKNSFTSPKDFRNLVSTKNETPTTLHKLSDTTLHIHTDLKSANPLHRVTSVGAMAPKINLDASEIAIIDQKATKADMLKRPTTASPHNQKSPSISSIPQRTMKDGLHSVTNFKFERVLGQGAYAVVKLAWDKIRGQKVAVKIYDKSVLADPRKMKNVRREISILKQMDHPNVIKLLDSFETPRQIYVVMEFVGKSSLHSFLRSLGPRKLEETEVKRIFSQLCQSISYCHRKNIVHRDIKLENILMDDQDNIKIIDFGFSICIGHDKKLNFFCGTPSYMAPEIVSKTLYKGAATDVWALGVILYILLCGHFPFRGNDDRELFYRIQKGKLEFPAHVPHDAKTFIQKLLKVNPDERLKIDEVLQDKWLSG